MKEPHRLFESSDNEVERLLLRAGHERAPRGAKRRALTAASGVLAASTLTAGNAVGAAVAGKAAAGAKAATTILSLKWLVVVGVASVGVAAGTVAVRASRPETAASSAVAMPVSAQVRARPNGASLAAAPRPTPSVPSAALPATPPPTPPPPVAPALPVGPPPVAPVAPVAPSAVARLSPPPPRASPSAGSSSAAELAMLDDARAAIDRGDATRGLSLLDAYLNRFPHGVMGPEASILRIEALVNAGKEDAAKREADAFLRANPRSPYAARIGSLLGTSNP